MRRAFGLLTALVAVSSATGAVVRLRESADVATPLITLGDVAEILTNDPSEQARLSKFELGPAPEAGMTQWLDLSEIKDRMYRRGLRLDGVEFAGVRRVEVRSPVRDAPAVSPAEVRAAEEWRLEMAALIRRSAEEDLGSEPPIRVRVEGDRASDFLAENPSVAWEISAPSRWAEGWQQAELLATLETQTVRFPLHVELLPMRPVVAARRAVQRGTKLCDDDLMLVSVETALEEEDYLFEPTGAEGMEAKRDLPAGKPIAMRDLKRPAVVFRGEPITVQVRFRTAWLQKSFLAGQDGGAGEWIEVHDPERKDGKPHDYMVRVTGPHAAELPPDAPLSAMAARSRPTTSARRNP